MMKGFVEGIAEHELRGWAFDEANPGDHLLIVARRDGTVVGTGSANILRPDLAAAGIGMGDHAFRIKFEPALAPSDLGRTEIFAESRGQAVRLRLLSGSNQSRADGASNTDIPIADPDQHPVFILGPARSGTSALALALLRSGRYEGNGEGHLMPLALELLKTVDLYYDQRRNLTSNDTTLRAVHLAAFQRMVRRGFVQLSRTSFPTGYWLDKTPTAEMVRAAPLMRELWPNARFIFLKRRVIENIQSRRRKFPHDTLENHYLDWVNVLMTWRSVRDALAPVALEIDQFDLARHSDAMAAKIAAFLDMPVDCAEQFRVALSVDRPEQTSETFGEIARLESLLLSTDDERELVAKCGEAMSIFEYSFGETYYKNH